MKPCKGIAVIILEQAMPPVAGQRTLQVSEAVTAKWPSWTTCRQMPLDVPCRAIRRRSVKYGKRSSSAHVTGLGGRRETGDCKGGAPEAEILADLSTRFPALKEQIQPGEQLSRYVNVSVNDQDMRYFHGLAHERWPDRYRHHAACNGWWTLTVHGRRERDALRQHP